MENRPSSHGNRAKIDPKKEVLGEFATNSVTLAASKKGQTPLSQEEAVELARKFSEENKK